MSRRTATRFAVVAVLFTLGCSANTVVAPDPRPAVAAFDSFWHNFDRLYPYFEHKKVDWNVVRQTHRESAADVESDSALVALLSRAVEPLRDVHIWFKRPNGTQLSSYVPAAGLNWSRELWLSYHPRLNWQQQQTNWGYGIVDDVGYIAVGAWNTSQVKIAEVDAALDQMKNTRGIIIDVRMNGGGNDALALQVAQRFASTSFMYASVQYRDGPRHTDFGKLMLRTLSPRGSSPYTKPVYLLVGRGCFSSNETFIAAMSVIPNVTVVGDTTGGSSGNPIEYDLVVDGRATGWRYSVPRWIERTADGRIIEWNGIAPDVTVPFDTASVARGVDPVLEWALARARQ